MDDPFLPPVGALLSESARRVQALRAEHFHSPVPGSPILDEWQAIHESPEASGVAAVAMLTYEVSAVQLSAAEDHIESLGELLLRRRSAVTPFVIARAAIEAAARAAHILNPRLSLPERASLVLAERIHELTELRKLMQGHRTDQSSDRIEHDIAELDAVVQRIRNFSGLHRLKGLKRPSFTDVVTKALATSGHPGSLVTSVVSAYSAVAHAVPDIVLAYTVDRTIEDWDPFDIGAQELSFDLARDMVVSVLVAYTNGVNLQINAHGWASEPWKMWLDHVRTKLEEALAFSLQGETTPEASSPSAEKTNWASSDDEDAWSIPIHPVMQQELEAQRREFIKKFGRPPRDGEPIFFDPAASDPEPTWISEDEYISQLIWLVNQFGQLTPAREHAIRRCGFVASTFSWTHFPQQRRAEWKRAIYEYYATVGLPAPPIEDELVVLPET